MKRTDLHEYQNYCVDFLKTHAQAMLILEMGLGKSVISLTAIADLMFDSFDVSKTLVIAPLRVARQVWPEERDTWEQASILKMSVMVGSAKQREAAYNTAADVYVINRENVRWLTDYLEKRRIPALPTISRWRKRSPSASTSTPGRTCCIPSTPPCTKRCVPTATSGSGRCRTITCRTWTST